MNCILYSGLVTKYNQISQNVDTAAHCPIILKGWSKTVVNKYTDFLSLTFFKIFTRQGMNLVKINGGKLKLKGRTTNIK